MYDNILIVGDVHGDFDVIPDFIWSFAFLSPDEVIALPGISDCILRGIFNSDDVKDKTGGGENSVIIYPNPVFTNQDLQIDVKTGDIINVKITIYNSLGQIVNEFEKADFNSNISLPVNEFAAGYYFVNILINNKITLSKGFVIIK